MFDIGFDCVPNEFARVKSKDRDFGLHKDDLADDGNPVQFNAFEPFGYLPDLNGKFVMYRKVVPITFSLTFLPFSYSDVALKRFLIHCMDPNGSVEIDQMTVNCSETAVITFTEGMIQGAQPGVGASGDGRMTNQTYSFMFSSMKSQGYESRWSAMKE